MSKAAGEDAPLGVAYTHCDALVREHDRDRWLAALFAPADKRPHLHALHAFDHEVARVREVVSQPLPGEIRLQWWRDLLEGAAGGDGSANPVAAALLDTIERFHLPAKALIDLVDARIFDLYDDPMPSLNDLEGYCGETSSALIRLVSLVLADGEEPGGAEAAGHAGVAVGLTDLMRDLPRHAARGQVYLPADLLNRHGVPPASVVAGEDGPALRAALGELRRIAREHLERTHALRRTIDARIAPAFLQTALAGLTLDRMERADYAPFRTRVDVPQWRKQWTLWREAHRTFA